MFRLAARGGAITFHRRVYTHLPPVFLYTYIHRQAVGEVDVEEALLLASVIRPSPLSRCVEWKFFICKIYVGKIWGPSECIPRRDGTARAFFYSQRAARKFSGKLRKFESSAMLAREGNSILEKREERKKTTRNAARSRSSLSVKLPEIRRVISLTLLSLYLRLILSLTLFTLFISIFHFHFVPAQPLPR